MRGAVFVAAGLLLAGLAPPAAHAQFGGDRLFVPAPPRAAPAASQRAVQGPVLPAPAPAPAPVPAPAPAAPAPAPAPAAVPPEQRILVQTWAEREAILSSPATGRIVQIAGPIGAAFRAGDVLIAFDCSENRARMQMAQAELTAANETLEAKIRMKALDSASEVEVSAAAAAVSKAQAQLHLTQYQVTQCVVTAPFAGQVVRVAGKVQQTVNSGTPLLEIVSAGRPKLRLKANSRLLPQLRLGQRLAVTIDETGRTYAAAVSAVNARVDAVNQTIELEARLLDAAPDLMPGMSGTALVQPDLPPARTGATR